MSEFTKLHDAVFLSMSHRWEDKYACCTFRLVAHELQTVDLIFLGVKELSIEAKEPWGASSAVNAVTCSRTENCLEFVIEMQSGDLIKINAENLDWIDK